MDKEQDCMCGIDENGHWSDEVFDRFGCDCDEAQERHLHCVSCDCVLTSYENQNQCRWCE
jgi:hypothetical protein